MSETILYGPRENPSGRLTAAPWRVSASPWTCGPRMRPALLPPAAGAGATQCGLWGGQPLLSRPLPVRDESRVGPQGETPPIPAGELTAQTGEFTYPIGY